MVQHLSNKCTIITLYLSYFSALFVFTYHNQIRRYLFLRQEVMARSMALDLDALTLAAYLTTWRTNAFLIGSETFIWVPRNTPSK